MRRISSVALILAVLAAFLLALALPHPVQAASTSLTASTDTYLDQEFTSFNYGGGYYLQVRSNTSLNNRTILKFDISSIPAGSTITSATLKLYIDSLTPSGTAGRTYWAYRLKETNWVEGTSSGGTQTGSSCWSHRVYATTAWAGGAGGGAADGTYTTTDGASATVPSSGWMSWTVTNQVQYAITNSINAHFLIRDGTEDAGSSYICTFRSTEYGSNPPALEVTYTPPPTVDLQIAASADDGFCDDSGNYPTYDYANCATTYVKSGLRWQINIPDGATITTAYIQLKSSGNNNGSRNGQIELFDEDSATNFSSSFWTRAVVSSPSAVLWDYTNWTDGTWYTSPSIKTLVQAFIDRTGYSSGNYIGLRITGQTEYEDWRAFYTYDNATADGAKLHIEYVIPPTVTDHPSNQNIIYGNDAIFTAAASGTPTPAVQWQLNPNGIWNDISGETSTTLTVTKPPVSYTDYQYRAVFTNGGGSATTNAATLTVTAKNLTVTGITADNKTYDGNTTATLNTDSAALDGVVGSDDVTLNKSAAAGAFDNKNVGTGKTVTISGLSLDGAEAGNYTLTMPTATADITERAITVTADSGQSKTQGDADPTLTYTVTSGSLVGGDSFTGALTRDPGEDPGTYPITLGTLTVSDGNSGNNYTLTYVGATFTINLLEAPTVTNSTGASNITQTSARLNGEVTSTGGNDPTVYIYWGDNDGGTTAGNWDNNVDLGTKGAVTFYTDISSLTANTTYYYRCYATNTGGSSWAASTAQFTTLDIPTVTDVTPNAGPVAGGTPITITGTNFYSDNTTVVTIGGVSATGITVVSSTSITATTPGGTAGAQDVAVTISGSTGTLTDGFTYVAVPTVSSVTPTYGSITGGTTITIKGDNFVDGSTTVTIGSTDATNVTFANKNKITAVTPASGTTGNADVKVTTPGGSDTLTDGFTYVVEAPTVTSVEPNSGSSDGGTTITITGTNFISGATVTIGGASATGVTVMDATTITATTPAGTAGAQDVAVTTDGGSDTLEDGFTYTEAPSVTNLGPTEYINGSFSSDTTPTLTFTLSDPNSSDNVSYQIQIAKTPQISPHPVVDYTSDLLAQGDATFTVGQAAGGGSYTQGSEGQTLVNGKYYWRVMSTDSNDNEGGWAVANSGSVAFRIDQNSRSDTTTPGDDTVTNTDGSTSVTKKGNGTPTITIARYTTNPGGGTASGFSAADSYIDVHASSTDNVTDMQIKHYYTDAEISGVVESTLRMYYWDGTAWTECSETGVNTTNITGPPAYSGYIWANIRSDTTPDLSYLLTSSFCGIGQTSGGGGGGGGGGGSVQRPSLPLTLNQLDTAASLTLDADGIINATARLKTPSGKASLYVAKGTKLLNSAGRPLTSLSASAATSPPAPPSGRAIVSAYDFGADGATFTPAITLTMSYDPAALPEGVSGTELYIAYWNGSNWVALNTTVDTSTHTLSAGVSHFTLFAILAKLPTTPEAYFEISNLNINPSQVVTGEEVIISAQVANTGGMSGEYRLTMNVEGLPETSQMVELAPGQSQGVSFTVTPDNPGSYQVEIGGLQGSFVVVASSLLEGEAGGFKWSLWLILVITTTVLAALAFILIRRRQQLAPVVTGEKPAKPLAKKLPALGPSRLGKMMAAVATLVRERLQPTTKTVATLVRKRLQPTTKAERPVPAIVEKAAPTVVTVKASVSGGHGSVNPISQVVNPGASATITITPDTRYRIASITDNGDAAAIANPYVISKVTADHAVVVTFATSIFTINASAGAGGSISPSGAVSVDHGAGQSFAITPDTGYHIVDVLVDGGSVGAVTSYEFTDVTADHTISATFAIDTFAINAEVSGGHGSVSPATQTVDFGTSAAITITPDTRCHIATITDNGSSARIANPYIIPKVTADHAVVVTFATDVKDLKIIPHQVKPGEVVNVFAEVTNNDPTTTTFSLVLKVKGIVEAVKEITLEPGQSQKVAFVTLRNKPGIYDIELEGLKGSFTVGNSSATDTDIPVAEKPSEPSPEASLAVMRDLKIIPHQVKPGEVVNVFAEVTNNDPTTTTFSLVLKVKGIVEAVKEITLEPGQSQKVAFVTLRNKPGIYDIELEGLKGSFTVAR